MPEAVFKLRNVSKTFGKHLVLQNITLDIFAGEILGIIGPSGSGKTTLLNVLIGFLTPERGDVLYRTATHDGFSQSAIYRSVFAHRNEVKAVYGFAAQTPSFYAALTVRENLDYFGSLYNLTPEARHANVATLLSLMELKAFRNLAAGHLSGGMERRLDIACSLMHDPDVLILDEPTADLDPVLRGHIWELIRKINKKGTTIVLCSHHLTDLDALCSRIGILRDGRLLAVDTPTALKATFSNADLVTLETYPGDYKRILDLLNSPHIRAKAVKGAELHLTADAAIKVLPDLLKAAAQCREHLIDLRITKPTLDDVFITALKRPDPAARPASRPAQGPPPEERPAGPASAESGKIEILTHKKA